MAFGNTKPCESVLAPVHPQAVEEAVKNAVSVEDVPETSRAADAREAGAADAREAGHASQLTPKPLPALPAAWTQDYEVVHERPVIGAGAFGTVFQVRHKATQQPFACKVIQRQFLEVRGIGSQLQAEIHFMHYASQSCRVARLLGAAEEAGCVFLLQELCAFGSLDHELRAQPTGYLPDARAARCAKHMLQGLMDLHSMGIIHRDIKLENLLVTTGGTVKLTDFGWAASAHTKPTDLAGTFHIMAPEILLGEPQSTAADLWSAGAVIFHMVTGRQLIQANIGVGATELTNCDPHGATRLRQQYLLDDINRTCPLSDSARPVHVSVACWDLLRQLLMPNAEQRLSASAALQHEWVREPVLQDQPTANLPFESESVEVPLDMDSTSERLDVVGKPVGGTSQHTSATTTPLSSPRSSTSTGASADGHA